MFWQRHHPIFRHFLLVSNAVLPAICLLLWFHQWPGLWSALILTVLLHAAILFAIFQPRCPWLGPVIRRFRTNRKAVWLTIDDGPNEHSAALAEALRERKVPATFFVIGEQARRHPKAVRSILAAGHSLANHTLNHPRAAMWCLTQSRATEEISGGAAALQEFGVATSWFRAAVGHKSPWLHPGLRHQGSRLISWTTGGRDGYGPDPESVIQRILLGTEPGSILLLHEGRPHAVTTILAVVDALQAQGFEFTIPRDGELEE